MATKTFKNHDALLADVVRTTCANCYADANQKRVHVGSIEGFIFCSNECALDAMKRVSRKISAEMRAALA